MLTIIDVLYLFFAALTIYFYLLFLLLFLQNKERMNFVPELKKIPSLSLIIPAFNEEKTIARTIKAAKRLIYPKKLLEIIVINDGSTDKTERITKSFKGIKVLSKKNEGTKAYALNFGLKHAKGELVACMDADSYPKKDALIKAIPFFNDKKVAGVTTSIFTEKTKNFIGLLQKIEYIMAIWTRKILEFTDGIYATPGPLSIYRKNILKKLGGFDVNNLTEDIEITWKLQKAGYKVRMSTQSEVYTKPPMDFKTWWSQRIRWNIGGLQTTNKYKKDFFNKDAGSLGKFIVPFFILSYFTAVLGFCLFGFLIIRYVFDHLTFGVQAISLGINPINKFIFIPESDIFTFFGILILLFSLLWVKLGFKNVNRNISGIKGVFCFLFYLTFYITILPLILIQSLFRWLRKKQRW